MPLAQSLDRLRNEVRKAIESLQYASVAQLDRVLLSEGKGCGFKSRRVHQRFKTGSK